MTIFGRSTMHGDKTPSAVEESSSAVAIIQQPGMGRDSEGGTKSSGNRKHVIIGVTCAVVIAMVVTGILIGVKFQLDSTSQLVTQTFEFTRNENEKVTEDIGVNVKANYVQYHIMDDDTEVTIIDDFNRELQVTKVSRREGPFCLVATLNTSYSAHPATVLSYGMDDILNEDEKFFVVSQTAVKDKTLLGTHGQKLCDNLEVFWMIQTCNYTSTRGTDSTTSDFSRVKRDFGFTIFAAVVVGFMVGRLSSSSRSEPVRVPNSVNVKYDINIEHVTIEDED